VERTGGHARNKYERSPLQKDVRDAAIVTMVKGKRYRTLKALADDLRKKVEGFQNVGDSMMWSYFRDIGLMKDIDGFVIYTGKAVANDAALIPDRKVGKELARADWYYANVTPRIRGADIIAQGFYTGHFLTRGLNSWRPDGVVATYAADVNTTIIACESPEVAIRLHRELSLFGAIGHNQWIPIGGPSDDTAKGNNDSDPGREEVSP
jgi:hypothetical protein